VNKTLLYIETLSSLSFMSRHVVVFLCWDTTKIQVSQTISIYNSPLSVLRATAYTPRPCLKPSIYKGFRNSGHRPEIFFGYKKKQWPVAKVSIKGVNYLILLIKVLGRTLVSSVPISCKYAI